ncbi:hypothetical protein V2J09_000418 [Rumex salicifolius]
MGGCCCCSSRRAEPNTTSTYYYFPRASEEQVPLSARNVGNSGLSAGLLVNPDLETSIPDTYIPPPPPLPYDLNSGNPPTPSETREPLNSKSDTAIQPATAHSVGEPNIAEIPASPEKDFRETDNKNSELELSASIDLESELKKSAESFVPAAEECPTCLEEYSEENPKIITKCEHHFHLACILEWMERSSTCPVCDKEMEIDNMFD